MNRLFVLGMVLCLAVVGCCGSQLHPAEKEKSAATLKAEAATRERYAKAQADRKAQAEANQAKQQRKQEEQLAAARAAEDQLKAERLAKEELRQNQQSLSVEYIKRHAREQKVWDCQAKAREKGQDPIKTCGPLYLPKKKKGRLASSN